MATAVFERRVDSLINWIAGNVKEEKEEGFVCAEEGIR